MPNTTVTFDRMAGLRESGPPVYARRRPLRHGRRPGMPQAHSGLALEQAGAVAQTHHERIEVGAPPLKETAVKKLPCLVAALAIAGAWSALPAQASQQLATKSGCFACHTPDRKLVGPSYKEIAAKYKGQTDVVPKLMDKVRKGGAGVYGPVPMAPNPPDKINDADLKAAVESILKS